MRHWVGVALAFALFLVAGTGGATTRDSFADAIGDTTGPDIARVSLTRSNSNFVVSVQLANRLQLTDDEAVEIDVDLDANAATGDVEGVDLYALLQGSESYVAIWQTGDFDETTRGVASFANSTATLTVPLELVGARATVSAAAAGAGDPDSPVADPEDFAPDSGSYTFTFTKRTLRSSSVSFTPRQPRAGLLFRVRTVAIDVSGVGPVKPEYTCAARLGAKSLRAATSCAWRIPPSARGRRLRVNVVATYEGERFVLPAKTFVVR